MRITCPTCGSRDLHEFHVLGEAEQARPRLSGDFDSAAARAAFTDYVYARRNPAGPHDEYWYHGPCDTWLVVRRDTRSHEVHDVRAARGGDRP
ncbi:sarcosine oxidase subunit delta [Oryzibacter oryziterrae]|uniref:sarcosine oxidase subunit delta n=1 Tax=Oryzibacter oryziterrae TaxID=2766474 RepID=UPI001F264584|nr:sarcosine oxidase subunit delta [Oryzibacter oryziterrae]